jgi:hypothetical protein
MSLSQQLTEFRFNLETLDLLNNMGKSSEYSLQMLGELGFNEQLVKFMQSNRLLLNSVLLRLQLYCEQNINEQKIRTNLSVLNNQSVNILIDYFYKSSKSLKSISQEITKPFSPPPQQKVLETIIISKEEENEDNDDNDEESHFDSFFTSCIQVSDDATHVVKMNAMYDAFTKWWSNNYEDETPSKEELKEYLSEKLGHPIKSNVSNVSLIA